MTTESEAGTNGRLESSGDQEELRFFEDDPTDGARSPDLLGRLDYADQVVALLDRVRGQSPSSVLALIGPWGSGKSSVLEMTLKKLSEHCGSSSDWRVAQCNPWNYPDIDALQVGFFAELREALPEGDGWSEVRSKIAAIAKALSPLGKVTTILGVDASSILDKASAVIAGDSLSRTHAAAETALNDYGKPILMVLDDLDRLTPDELLRTLKLVRLVGRLPNVYYLLCYDERTLLDVLQRTELVGHDESRARDYMEKIVQVRLDVPRLRSDQASNLLDSAFGAFLRRNDVSLADRDKLRLGRVYDEVLRKWLTTPRAIKRFVAQLDAFYGSVAQEVDVIDFAILTWIRTARPSLHDLIQVYRAELTMTAWSLLFDRESGEKQNDRWRTRLIDEAKIPTGEIDDMLYLLDALFAAVHPTLRRISAGDSTVGAIARRQGVGHIDYFDRYFAFGIPEGDLPDGNVLAALALLAEGKRGPAVEELVAGLVTDTQRTIRKLQNVPGSDRVPAGPLLELLGQCYARVESQPGSLFADPRRSIEFYAEHLITEVDDTVGPQVLRAMASSEGGLTLAGWTVARASRPSHDEGGSKPPLTWQSQAAQTVLELARAELDKDIHDELPASAGIVYDLVWPWYHLDRDGLAVWLRTQIDAGRWQLLDVLAGFVAVGAASSSEGSFKTLGEVSLAAIDELLGLDAVIASLSEQIDVAEPPKEHRYEVAPTWENRRRAMLVALQAERTRRDQPGPAPDTG